MSVEETEEDDHKENMPSYKIKKKHALLAERLKGLGKPHLMNENSGVSLLSMKDTLNRFRLIGPHSVSILKKVFLSSSLESKLDESLLWWQDYFPDETRKLFHRNNELWDTLKPASKFDSNFLLPLIVRDPRLLLPTKQQKLSPLEIEGVLANDLYLVFKKNSL